MHVNNSKSAVERGGEGSGDFINVTIKFTWTPYNALHNLVPRSYRVTDWNVILPVKGLVTRLALQYSDDPSPPPSLTFYDLPSTVVVCNYHYWKYMQVIRLIHTSAKFEWSRTASFFFYYWTTIGLFKWNFSFEYMFSIFYQCNINNLPVEKNRTEGGGEGRGQRGSERDNFHSSPFRLC